MINGVKGPIIQRMRPVCMICQSAFHTTADHGEIESQYSASHADRRRVASSRRSLRPLAFLMLASACLVFAGLLRCTIERRDTGPATPVTGAPGADQAAAGAAAGAIDGGALLPPHPRPRPLQ